jgi:hypothetical protein
MTLRFFLLHPVLQLLLSIQLEALQCQRAWIILSGYLQIEADESVSIPLE